MNFAKFLGTPFLQNSSRRLLLFDIIRVIIFPITAYRENYREEDELEAERRMRDVDVNGRTKYVDLDKEKQIKGTPPPSKDEIIQHDIENDEDEWDMKEDEKDMMVDEFEDVDEGETTAMNDRNKHVLTGTNQEKQGSYFIFCVCILLISSYIDYSSKG